MEIPKTFSVICYSGLTAKSKGITCPVRSIWENIWTPDGPRAATISGGRGRPRWRADLRGSVPNGNPEHNDKLQGSDDVLGGSGSRFVLRPMRGSEAARKARHQHGQTR